MHSDAVISRTLMAFELLVLFCVPALMVRLTKKNRFFKRVGAITLCYAFGFLLALSPIPYDRGLSETVASVLVALAIPLILFSFDVRQVRRLAKKTLISFALVAVSVIAVSVAAALIGKACGASEKAHGWYIVNNM